VFCVQDILVEVDTQVAEKEKEDRKLEMYNRIEAKSFTVHRGHKFKKSDILSKNRRLRSVVRDSMPHMCCVSERQYASRVV
jgi:hypothetical protein